ncbi:MAG TPA: LysM peptidoglycan-binding domain-containing protein [Gemmatales bacterium]|nr:LysM peptidoglycan-binding domain-containing protein [Gemmatales bacterium]
MSRDMQIGLLLAVGFLALVGGVLFYRIEHPDELEQFLSGNETQASTAGTAAPNTSIPDQPPAATTPANSGAGASTMALNTTVPPAPVNNPPAFDTGSAFNPPPMTTTPPPVVQTAAPATVPTVTTVPTTTNTAIASNGDKKPGIAPVAAVGAAGALALGAMGSDKKSNDNKSVSSVPAADQKKPDASGSARTSLPMDPPGLATPPAPAVNGPPSIALDLTPKTTTTPPGETKKATEMVIKPDPLATNAPPSGVTPPGMSPPAMTPPSATGNSLPTPPAAGGGIVMTDPTKNPLVPEKKSNEMPQPPVVTPPANGGISFDTTKPAPPTTTTPTFGSPPPMNSPLNTTITPTNTPGNVTPTNTNPPPVTDADGFRTYAPKAGLGKPMPESEVALREKRWGDAAGNPAPIIPSSVDNRSNAPSVVPAVTTGRRGGVVQDTYMPTELAVPGETFSSLSQRLYGDTNYAVALAAFNKEEGFVKLDQPTPGEKVAKPNREILDQKYPQLVRRLTPTNLNPNNMAMLANNANAKNGSVPAATTANANLPTYRVGKGEQLFEVAKKTLGDGYRWSEIYALNKEMLRDSTELRPDMVLKLPAEARK